MEGIKTKILVGNKDAEYKKFKTALTEWCKLNAPDIFENIDFDKAIDYCYKDLSGIDEVACTELVAYATNFTNLAADNFILKALNDRYFLPCKREAQAVIKKIYSYKSKLKKYEAILDNTLSDELDAYIRDGIEHSIIYNSDKKFINLDLLADYNEVEYYFSSLFLGNSHEYFMTNRKGVK